MKTNRKCWWGVVAFDPREKKPVYLNGWVKMDYAEEKSWRIWGKKLARKYKLELRKQKRYARLKKWKVFNNGKISNK